MRHFTLLLVALFAFGASAEARVARLKVKKRRISRKLRLSRKAECLRSSLL